MAYTFLTPVDMSGLEIQDVRAESLATLPAMPDATQAGRYVYNLGKLWYSDGVTWAELGTAGTGAPPTGPAGGDLSGTYPDPQIAAGVIVDADVAGAAAIAQSKIAGLVAALDAKADDVTAIIAGLGLTGGGTLGVPVALDVVPKPGGGVVVDATGVSVDATLFASQADLALKADKTTAIIAGGGLTGDGTLAADTTLVVGTLPGSGVLVNADDIAVDPTVVALKSDLTTVVDSATTITAGAGLTGGGDLTVSRTLDVVTVAGSGITVTADAIAADLTVLQARAEKGVANGYAPLDASNLIPTIHLPPMVINEVHVVVDEAEMITLVGAAVGDMAICTGTSAAYVLSAADATVLANWTQIQGAGQVISVNGETGVVTLDAVDVGAAAAITTVTAGAGLTGGGDLTANRTFDVVGDATLSVTADAVSVLSAPKWTTPRDVTLTGNVTGAALAVDGTAAVTIATTIDPAILAGQVPTTRSVVAGAGLAGGGALAADVTLNVASSTADLVVGADALTVVSAPKWTAPITLNLTGDVSGTGSINGDATLATVNIPTTLAASLKRFAADVVGGALTEAVAHGLNTLDVLVQVYEVATGATVVCDIARTDVNTVTLGFAAAPAAGTYRVVATG